MTFARLQDSDFPQAGEERWRALVDQALKEEPFASLRTVTEDGFAVEPLYARLPEPRPLARLAPAQPWTVVQRVDDPDAERGNAQALADLEGGASGLSLVFQGSAAAFGFGLPLEPQAIERALDGVMLEMVHLRIEPNWDARVAVEVLQRLCERRSLDFNALDLDLCLDGIGPYARYGVFPGEEPRFRSHAGRATKSLVEGGFHGRTAEADGRVYHDAGATAGQELGAVLATAVYYLRAMTDAGMAVDTAAKAIGFTLAVDQRQFVSTAKLRAARLLWSRVQEASGIAEQAECRIHAETSWRMMAARDPHTNMLRTTIAAFAAGTGGADSVSVLPYTIAHGLPNASARRIARNTQVILAEESGLHRVADPAAGAGGIEALTEGLCEAGWGEFTRIESEGGIFASLSAGALQSRVLGARARRQAEIDEKRQPMIGVTIYPIATERDIAVLMPRGEAADQVTAGGGQNCQPLAPHRLSEKAETAA